ncbi:MAG: sodium/solute symporter [Elusimicrobiales bacterium]|nr:sodium/solute symporter [Elusimicrobiales bacterium]
METLSSVQKITGLGGWDYLILAASLLFLAFVAWYKGKDEEDTHDYFLGKRKTPVWVGTLSFVATEISAMTIVGIPPVGFTENLQYMQFFIGSAIARVIIAFLFIPAFYKFSCTTIYEFLKHRFGVETQYCGSIFFFITRLFASGVRLYAAALAVSVIMGWPLMATLAGFTVAAILFIGFGGIKAVLWTGTFETVMFYAAGFGVCAYILCNVDGGISGAYSVAHEAGKLSMFNFAWDPANPNVFWSAILNGIFGSMASFGTDQEMMQRLLTLETRKESQKTLILTIAASVPLTALYLLVGTLLYVFYQQNPGLPQPDNADKILSHFTIYVLPAGLKGLVLSAIVLASIDSPLSSLSSSFITDIYRPIIKKNADEKHYLLASRISVLSFGILLAVIAWLCASGSGRMFWLAFKINGVTAGSLLGVFLFGLLTKMRGNKLNVASMLISALSSAIILWLSEKGIAKLGWSWIIVIGTAITFSLSCLFSWGASKIKTASAQSGKNYQG